ncbi:hypothetical protein LZ31DRAFT_548967 [Colletotrichum somersetense]|nr:hypothetical protein LZ31DRAFT_548967 [Colletotrichum somersetense]
MNHSPFPQTRHSLHNLLHLFVLAPPIKPLRSFPFGLPSTVSHHSARSFPPTDRPGPTSILRI